MSYPLAHGVLYCAAGAILLLWVGNRLCKWLLDASGLTRAMEEQAVAAQKEPAAAPRLNPKAGRIIGILERILIAAGIVLSSWEIMAAVIALKTVARFKEIDERLQAEYFLVGSLFSIVWALLVTQGWMLYDKHLGLDLMQFLNPKPGR